MKAGMTLLEMAQEITRQRDTAADYLVDTRRLEMDASGNGIVMKMIGDDGADAIEPLDVRPIAHRQIGTHLKIPAPYYDRMLDLNPGLLADNVNSWFRREPVQRMVRTIDGSARAFLSNKYRPIDNHEILEAVLPVIGEIPDARCESCQITESRMYVKVINPRLQTEVSVGDIVQAGIMISNSEVGQGAVSVQPLILRLICMNGMVVNDARTRRNHVGRVNSSDENFLLYSDKTLEADDRAFMLKIQDTVRAAVDEAKFGRVVDIMRQASGAKMDTGNIPGIVKLAGKDYGLTEGESNGVLNRLIEDHNFTLYGLSNAVTRYSQDVDSYDRATDLEGIGYNILTMDPGYWNRLNRDAPLMAA
jgi:hypothetical protein